MNKIYLQFLKRKITYRLKKKLKNISHTSNTPNSVNTLLVSNMLDRPELGETMLYPFYWHEQTLRKGHGIEFTEMLTSDLLVEATQAAKSFKEQPQIERIFFQPEFEMEEEAMANCLAYLKEVYPNAKIAYMDWYAPLHIKYAHVVDPFIDVYIKKQTYVDFDNYSKPTVGDTNLSDFYAKKHNLELPSMLFTAPKGFEDKIVLWSNFALSPLMIDLFLAGLDLQKEKPIDLHSRVVVNGTPWYKAMRQDAKDAIDNLQLNDLNIASEGLVSRSEYYKEMTQSKMCFSPFGYGEVCWRDYESFATGALLLKPNMDHLKVFPDIFVPDETYVSLEWNLSDFEDKVREYSKNEAERTRIASNAYNAIHESILNKDIVHQIASLY